MPEACDIQDLNRVLRQPIFEPLSDVLIARLVMLFRELNGFLRSLVSSDTSEIKRLHRYRGHSIRYAEDRKLTEIP